MPHDSAGGFWSLLKCRLAACASLAVIAWPDLGQNIPILLAIVGTVSSFLVIINPGKAIINAACSKRDAEIQKIAKGAFVSGLLESNSRTALHMPAITYEAGKVVGIAYFFIVLMAGAIKACTMWPEWHVFDRLAENPALAAAAIAAFIAAVIFALVVFIANFRPIPRWTRMLNYSTVTYFDKIKYAMMMGIAVDLKSYAHIIGSYKLENMTLGEYQLYQKCAETFEQSRNFESFEESVKNDQALMKKFGSSRQAFYMFESIRPFARKFGIAIEQALWAAVSFPIHDRLPKDAISSLRDAINAKEWDTAGIYSSVIESHINRAEEEINKSAVTKDVRKSLNLLIEKAVHDQTDESMTGKSGSIIIKSIIDMIKGLKIRNLMHPAKNAFFKDGKIDIESYVANILQSNEYVDATAATLANMFKGHMDNSKTGKNELEKEIKKMLKSKDFVKKATSEIEYLIKEIYKETDPK